MPLFAFRGYDGRRSLAYDLDNGLPILSPVIMDLFRKMRDEAAGRHGHCALRFKLAARAYPPCTGDHRDKPVIRMKMWPAHLMRLPFHEFDVETSFVGIAMDHRYLRADRRVLPFDLAGQLVDQRRGIQISLGRAV